MEHGSFGQTMDLRPYEFTRPKNELPYLQRKRAKQENDAMTPLPDFIRISGRLSALENLVASLVFDRARACSAAIESEEWDSPWAVAERVYRP
jgi:hypothetical protein